MFHVEHYTALVYTGFVKNITFSADEHLIEQARRTAAAQHITLNEAFRKWLEDFAGRERRAKEFDAFMDSLEDLRIDRKYTRDEMNER